MNDQPIILEQDQTTVNKDKKSSISDQKFFTLLDEVQQYDSVSSKIRQKYQDAMLGLASIKFTDPHALKSTAHRCIPAFVKITDQSKLQYGYANFSNKVQENDVYFDQFEDQEQISQQCAKKQQKLSELKSQKQKKQFCENQLLYRFNVSNQQDRVLNVSSQFKQLLQMLLELNKCKNKFDRLASSVEKE